MQDILPHHSNEIKPLSARLMTGLKRINPYAVTDKIFEVAMNWKSKPQSLRFGVVALISWVVFAFSGIGTSIAAPESNYFKSHEFVRYFLDGFLGSFATTFAYIILEFFVTIGFSPFAQKHLERRSDLLFNTLSLAQSSDHQRVAFLLDSGRDGKKNESRRRDFMEYVTDLNYPDFRMLMKWVQGIPGPEHEKAGERLVNVLMPNLTYVSVEDLRDRVEEVLQSPIFQGLEKLSIVLAYNALADMKEHVFGKDINPDAKLAYTNGIQALDSKLNSLSQAYAMEKLDPTAEARRQLALAIQD